MRTLCLVTLALVFAAGKARAEVPATPEQGREFRVDFSARHLDVDAELGELSLSGNVVVTVGRYRLGGERVQLRRGPRGISVEGGGDIAFCSCEEPPITLGYRSVTIAPPSDVIIQSAVLRAGPVPLFWLPYLWLRSPDRVGLLLPSVEWRGADGLLVGSGLHVPFSSNQGRPSTRALDLGGFAYLKGGARVDVRLLTPQSSSLIRWDHVGGTALTMDAHAASAGQSGTVWAFDVDASRGARGREALTSLDAAARRYDHARVGVGTSGSASLALGAHADAARGAWLADPASVGPFALLSTGGNLGEASSYTFDVAAGSWVPSGTRGADHESRGVQRATLESSLRLGPTLVALGAFEQGEWSVGAARARASLRAGAGLGLSLPLVRRFGALSHVLSPSVTARWERRHSEQGGGDAVVASLGVTTALGSGLRGAATQLRLAGGVAGTASSPAPVAEAELGSDSRWLGLRLRGLSDLREGAAETTARVRVGARGAAALSGFVEARTEAVPELSPQQAGGDVLPPFREGGGYDRAGLTSGGELTFPLWSVLLLSAGIDVDAVERELLAVRSFARYRHPCGCFAVAAFGNQRLGRGGFDAGLSLDLMP